MRVKKIDGQQRIVLTLEEANDIQGILSSLVASSEEVGFIVDNNEVDCLNNKLDEAILRAESL